MTNFDLIPFNPQIDFIILNMKRIQSLVDRAKNSKQEFEFGKKLASEDYSTIRENLENLNHKLERFLTNCEKAGFIYDFELEQIPYVNQLIELVVTQDDIDNFSWRDKSTLNHLLIALCFMDRSIDLLFIQQDPKVSEPNFHLIEEDFNEVQLAIRSFITVFITTSFISQEARQLTTVFYWGLVR
nr:hypothetical protein [Navicula tsukamotoi]UXN44532.1 hypothetical protein [Navicula tsukamotoi]